MSTTTYLSTLSHPLIWKKYAGEQIGNAHYKKFRPDKTRLTTDEVDDVWLAVRLEMQGKLNDEYGKEQKSFMVPGVEEITIDKLIPISENAKGIMGSVSSGEIERELEEAKQKLTKDGFLQNLRTVAWAHWEKEFDLFKDDEPTREILKK